MRAIENEEVKSGDIVLYKSFTGREMDFGGKKYLIIPFTEIFAKVGEREII